MCWYRNVLHCIVLYCIVLNCIVLYCIVLYGMVLYYRVIALMSVNIVPSCDIEGRELASVHRYPNEGQYSPISVP